MGNKLGLVLEGGAMRGMYTAGVLDVLTENAITFDGVAGVSAGALFGVNFLSRQTGRVIRYNRRFNQDRNYMGIRPFLREGNLFSTEYAYRSVPLELDPFDNEAFKASGVPFYAGVTNVDTGEPEYMLISDVIAQMDILRASGSMPIVSQCVEIGGKRYLDGGITDSIPFEWFFSRGYTRQVVILTQDGSYTKKPFPKLAAKLLLRKYPKVAERMLLRHRTYMDQLEGLKRLEKDSSVLVIRPSLPITIGRIERNEEKLQQVYDLGRRDCQKMLPQLRQFTEGEQ